MPILTKTKSWRPLVQSVREIRLGVPFERADLMRHFYHALLGLRARENGQKVPGGWLLGDSRAQIHFCHCHTATGDPLRRRLAITVPSLKQLEQRLNDVGWSYRRQRGLNFGDDLLTVTDPAGYVVELRQSQPL